MTEEYCINEIDGRLDKTEDYEIIINLLYQKVDLLESIIGKKNKTIDLISKNPYNELRVNGILFTGTDIKQYFANQAKEVEE